MDNLNILDIVYDTNNLRLKTDLNEVLIYFMQNSISFKKWVECGKINVYSLNTNKTFIKNIYYIIVDRTYTFEVSDIKNLFVKIFMPLLNIEIKTKQSNESAKLQQNINTQEPINMTGYGLNKQIKDIQNAREELIQSAKESLPIQLYKSDTAANMKFEQRRQLNESMAMFGNPSNSFSIIENSPNKNILTNNEYLSRNTQNKYFIDQDINTAINNTAYNQKKLLDQTPTNGIPIISTVNNPIPISGKAFNKMPGNPQLYYSGNTGINY